MAYMTKIRAIGHSRGVIIPQEYVSEVGTEYTIRKIKGSLVLSPKIPDIYDGQEEFAFHTAEEWGENPMSGEEKI